ncbi:FHA domain-containing protein [Synechococcus sp. PCC 7336]|uniref:FHA domain-containing protein n=1 Tax=Synechococcus sp. PCC 7336 TaxID=195250 RepID=UPI00036CFE60|nr:FHA domain-containing protein [Synechococcus sp. PCC 7336]
MGRSLSPQVFVLRDRAGKRALILQDEEYTIGRSSKCSIRLFDPFISRCHAYLRRIDRGNGQFHYLLVDGNTEGHRSANGMFINDAPAQSRLLRVGDVINFGPQVTALLWKAHDIPTAELELLETAFTRAQMARKHSETRLPVGVVAKPPTELVGSSHQTPQ